MQNLNFDDTVRLCGGKAEIAKDIIQMMINDLPAQKVQLEQAYQHQNWEELAHLTHKLVGAALYCAMEELTYTAKMLNASIRQKKLQDIPQQYTELQNAIDAVMRVATNELNIHQN